MWRFLSRIGIESIDGIAAMVLCLDQIYGSVFQ